MTYDGLTYRQRDLLIFIQSYLDEHGVSPSFDEMKAAIGLASKSGIHRLVTGLEQRGWINRGPYHRSRVLTVKRRWDASHVPTRDMLSVSRRIREMADRTLEIARRVA